MNVDKCANCLMHGWKEVEDESTLQRCKRCKVVKYCGKDCQTDHWKRLHHKHCKHFLDPTNSERWIHKEDECYICRKAALIGKSQIRRPQNPNYECVFKEVEKIIPPFLHPHPFLATAQEGTTYEKTLTVLWQLLKKFQLTQPEAAFKSQEDMMKVFRELTMNRLSMWGVRKITPEYENSRYIHIGPNLLDDISEEVEKSGTMSGPFQLWKTIQLVNDVLSDVRLSDFMNSLVNPLTGIPSEFHAIFSTALGNSTKFLGILSNVLEALATKVIPFEDVLTIICNGNLKKTCTFCTKHIIISSFSPYVRRGPTVYFSCMYTQIYICDRSVCVEEALSLVHSVHFAAIVVAEVNERRSMKCDFCFRLPPVEEVHRCSRCLTVMYCSKDCQLSDWKIHKITCKEDVEERKKKDGGSGRRKKAMDELEEVQKKVDRANIQGVGETVTKFRLNNSLESELFYQFIEN